MDSCKNISINLLGGISLIPLSTEVQKLHLQQFGTQC